ncbi:hypothetical protein D3C73_1584350 [compost metagenome]
MSSAVYFEIAINIGFVYTHFFAILIRQNFRTAASQRFQTCFLQLLQNFLNAQTTDASEEINLGSCVSF